MAPRVFYATYEAGGICDEGGFSWRACDSCGSHLGGNRYDAHALRGSNATGDWECEHIAICEDCLCYHANGDIPEHWGD